MTRQAFDKAAEILKTRPNHFYSLSAIERLVYTLPPPPKPADLDTAERVSKYLLDNPDAVFAASNKPTEVKDAESPFLTELEMREFERKNTLLALELAQWRVSGPDGAAKLLGIKPTTLTDRMKKLELRKPS